MSTRKNSEAMVFTTANMLEVLVFLARHLKRRRTVIIVPIGACWECSWQEGVPS